MIDANQGVCPACPSDGFEAMSCSHPSFQIPSFSGDGTCMHTYTYTCTYTYTDTYTYTNTHTYTYTYTYACHCTYTYTYTYTYADTDIDTDTDTDTDTYHIHIHIHTHNRHRHRDTHTQLHTRAGRDARRGERSAPSRDGSSPNSICVSILLLLLLLSLLLLLLLLVLIIICIISLLLIIIIIIIHCRNGYEQNHGAGFTDLNTKAGDLLTIVFRNCKLDAFECSIPSRVY